MDDHRVFVPIERESPIGRQHLHTITAGALLPFLQAALSGLIAFLIAFILASTLKAASPWKWGGVAGAIALGLTWLSLQRHWFSLTSLEKITGLDLNRDGVIGAPPAPAPQPRTVHVRLSETTGGNLHITDSDLPASFEQLQALANGLSQGVSLSEQNWTGAGHPFSINEFRSLRNELLKRGFIRLASEKDNRQGFILTRGGEALIEHLSPSKDPDRLQGSDR